MTPARRLSATVRTGFTLIELIVVIAIIGILAAISLLVGGRVIDSGRIAMTKSLLRVLDSTQDSYFTDRDAKVPYKFTDTSLMHNEFGIIDGRLGFTPDRGIESERAEPSATFFMLATEEAPSVKSAIGGFDTRYIVRSPIDNGAPPTDPKNFSTIYTKSSVKPQTATAGEAVYGLVIKDPWGNAIRYVHPKFQDGYGKYWDAPNMQLTLGTPTPRDATFNASRNFSLNQNNSSFTAQFRRSYRPFDPRPEPLGHPVDIGDADEGLCTGGRGYFYSPGKDGDPGTRIDNVYLDPPQFPTETAKLAPIQ